MKCVGTGFLEFRTGKMERFCEDRNGISVLQNVGGSLE